MRFSGNKWQSHGMFFDPALEYLLSSHFKHKSSSRCKWTQMPDYHFRFSAWWNGCSRPSPCGKLVSILKADGIYLAGLQRCERVWESVAFPPSARTILWLLQTICVRRPHAGHTQSHLCLPNHTLTNVYKFCLLLNSLAARLSPQSGAERFFRSGHLWGGGGDGGSVLRCNFDTVRIHKQEVGACSDRGSKMSHS